jgi:hypothetical protein
VHASQRSLLALFVGFLGWGVLEGAVDDADLGVALQRCESELVSGVNSLAQGLELAGVEVQPGLLAAVAERRCDRAARTCVFRRPVGTPKERARRVFPSGKTRSCPLGASTAGTP